MPCESPKTLVSQMMKTGQGSKQEDEDKEDKNAQADQKKAIEKLEKAGKAEAEHKDPRCTVGANAPLPPPGPVR